MRFGRTDRERERAEDLERLLADSGFDARQGEVRRVAELADVMRRNLAPPSPTAAVVRRVRARVWEGLPRATAAPRGALRPAYALAVLALVVLGSVTGVAFVAEAALPGDALYPVKRGLEQAQVALSSDDAALAAAFADRRLEEIEALTSLERWDDVGAAVDSYEAIIEELAGLEGTSVEGQLESHLEVLERVRRQAPEAALPGLDRAIERAKLGRDEARERREGKGPPPHAPGQDKKEDEGSEAPEASRTPRRPGSLPPGWPKKLTPTATP